MRLPRLISALGGTAILLSLAAVPPASATPTETTPEAAPATATVRSDVREIAPGTRYALGEDLAKAARDRTTATPRAAGGTPPVGTVRRWLALDDVEGVLYLKDYTLRAVGRHIEVWVATGSDDVSSGTAFPAGDCRNPVPGSTRVTAAQARALAGEFDRNIFPKESAAFSVAPDRDGSSPGIVIPGTDFTGDGDKTVTLVDNVRDANFYDFPANPTYIAGFFSSQFNEIADRNIMTIDAFDWLHRSGADPVDAATSDPCTSRPARSRLYEGVFAHEYQHLLQYYRDPLESNFVNEGLSDFAISLVGYANTTASVRQPGNESHIICFQGFGSVRTPYNPNPRDCGGPQNSLTLWGDEGSGSEILADYGNAWSFQLFLYDRYGRRFITALHRDGGAQGLAGVQDQLDRFAPGTEVADVVHDFQVMNLVDGAVGGRGGAVTGDVRRSQVTSASLRQRLNLASPASYALDGASPNGADYVTLRDRGGRTVPGRALREVSFRGASDLPPLPLLWTSVTDAPGRAGNPTLWSGNESNLDSAAVVQVDVPAGDATLTYTERHLAEATYDYAYTVVSTDGGETYVPLANANTVAGPLGPALNGDSAAFATQTFDLSAYAGTSVLVGFRYVSDGGVNNGGWFVDDVRVGGALVSDGSDASAFSSPTQVNPTDVANWDLRLVGLDAAGRTAHVEEFDGHPRFSVRREVLARFRAYPAVVAVVAYDDPTEQVQQYASYRLYVNGVLQPGG